MNLRPAACKAAALPAELPAQSTMSVNRRALSRKASRTIMAGSGRRRGLAPQRRVRRSVHFAGHAALPKLPVVREREREQCDEHEQDAHDTHQSLQYKSSLLQHQNCI